MTKRPTPITCADCHFHREMLCVLRLSEPCPTFRPASKHGLRPPPQAPLVYPPHDLAVLYADVLASG